MASTFLLGVGCQKGGTTWLYDYLAGSPQFAHGYRKEYHIFDALDLPSERHARRRLIKGVHEVIDQADAGKAPEPRPGHWSPAAQTLHRAAMFVDPETYYDYFANLVATRPGARLAADVTPAYAMLSADRFARIRDGFASRDVRPVAAYLMRDPVDRIWSQIRYHQKLYPNKFGEGSDSVQLLLDNFASGGYALRTAYHRTIDALDAVFDDGDVYYGFYEDLFTEASVQRLCATVGIDYHSPELDRRVNATPKTVSELPERTTQVVAEHFRDVYKAVEQRFPAVDLRELWPSSRFVL